MATLFHYDSREHHQPLTRQWRFLAFLLVIAAVILTAYLIYFFIFEWSSEHRDPGFMGGFAIGLAATIPLFIVFLIVSKKSKWGYSDFQKLVVDDQKISWLLRKDKGEQSARFEDIKYGFQDHRHLILKMNNDEEIWIENYTLIDKETQWDSFLQAVRQKIEIKG